MTHGEKGGCCGGSAAGTDKKGECCDTKGGKCCGSSGKLVTVLSVAVAIGALAYAASKDGTVAGGTKAAKPKVDVSTLIKGEDTVVAKLNGKEIKKSDVALAIKDLGANVPADSIDQILPAFLEQYINLQLINEAAEKEGVASDPEVVTQIVSSEEQIIRAAYLRKMFDGKLTDDALKAAYKAKYEDQPMPQEVKASHILVDDEAKAKELITKLNEGANFAKLAEENSKDPSAKRGGDLGYFVQTDMVKEFGDAAFSMPVGSISKEPIKTQFGWHVVKVEDKRQRAKPSFEEAKAALEQEIRQTLLDAKLNELRSAAKIETVGAKDAAAPAAEGAAPAAPAEAAPAAPAPEAAPAPAQ